MLALRSKHGRRVAAFAAASTEHARERTALAEQLVHPTCKKGSLGNKNCRWELHSRTRRSATAVRAVGEPVSQAHACRNSLTVECRAKRGGWRREEAWRWAAQRVGKRVWSRRMRGMSWARGNSAASARASRAYLQQHSGYTTALKVASCCQEPVTQGACMRNPWFDFPTRELLLQSVCFQTRATCATITSEDEGGMVGNINELHVQLFGWRTLTAPVRLQLHQTPLARADGE